MPEPVCPGSGGLPGGRAGGDDALPRRVEQLPAGVAWGVGLAVAFGVLLLAGAAFGPVLSRVFESIVLLGLVLWCFRITAFRRVAVALRPAQRILAGGIIVLLIAGQIAGNKRFTYPFVDWGMYCNPVPPVHYYEYTAELVSGEEVPYPFQDVAPTRSNVQFSSRFNQMLDRALAGKTMSLEDAKTPLRQLGELYTLRHPETPIRALRVERKSLYLDAMRNGGALGLAGTPVIRVGINDL